MQRLDFIMEQKYNRDKNYYIFESSTNPDIALSADYRNKLSSIYANVLEKLLIVDLALHGFQYKSTTAKSNGGSVTQGSYFYYFTVATYIESAALPRGMLTILLNRIPNTWSYPDPHFSPTIPMGTPDDFFDYSNPTSTVNIIVRKLFNSFEMFEDYLHETLEKYNFQRTNYTSP
ncbi:unnamed protein product [Didymodactylos carnosus]|uniref:Uncharacterized protein n=1 Tax=Didymodactylos carnosus TaxID=1234261 RepID=A0A815RIW0_9BILA|nr:unnamed protein product [Didymodactylos carnosus]CAF4343511.1 unnamed protein product [Didymodactylos carnosus]